MSSSSNSPHNPPAEEEEEGKNEENLELPETAEKITDPIDDKQKGKEIINVVVDDRKDNAVAASTKVDSSSSRDPKKELVSGEEDDDEGFKTPTSSDHKIPAITQCPPAPIKPRPPKLLKRKASPPPSGARRSLQYGDSSTEVESIFRPVTSDQKDNVEEQESKRAKNNDDEDRRD